MKRQGYYAAYVRNQIAMDGTAETGWCLYRDGQPLFVGTWPECHELCLRLSGFPLVNWEQASGDPDDPETWEVL